VPKGRLEGQRKQEKGLHTVATRVPDLLRSTPVVPIHRLLKQVLNTIMNRNCPPSKLSLALVVLDSPKAVPLLRSSPSYKLSLKVSKTPTSYPYIKPVLLLVLTSTSYRPMWKYIHPPSNRPNQATTACACTVCVGPPPILPLSKRYSKRNARSSRNEPVGRVCNPPCCNESRCIIPYQLGHSRKQFDWLRGVSIEEGGRRCMWRPVWGVWSMCFNKSIQRIYLRLRCGYCKGRRRSNGIDHNSRNI
jgi:hypothetical protein